ncbi:APC family permease [Thorsellia kenyensis]|uniref:APC family permease n=1 Tax=Thorsellia kenyensis TaxID=1549888 RepID=A0ABV6C6V2_9GAMM
MSSNIHNEPIRLKKTLTLFAMVMMGLAYLQPMTVFDTFGLVQNDSRGHVPTAYIFALVAMLFTAYSYGQMVKRFPSAGSAYTYTQKTVSPHIGFMVGWSSMLDYLLMPMINILLAKLYLHEIMPFIPAWVFVIVLTVAMTAANIYGLELVSNFNKIIVLVQIGIIVVFTALMIYKINAGTDIHQQSGAALFTTKPFFSDSFDPFLIIGGATILCFSFLGFDGISSLTEETHNARKVVPKAIFLTAFVGGVLFIIVSYVLEIFFPYQGLLIPSLGVNIPLASHFSDLSSTQPDIIKLVAGTLAQSVILVFSSVTVVASGLASQAGVSRLMYVMGRDGVLPRKVFGHLHPKFRTPIWNLLIAGGLCLVAVNFDADLGYSLIAFGALVAFTFVNVSVIAKFYFAEKQSKTLKDNIKYLLLPLLGIIAVSSLWFSLETRAMYLGLIWAGIGFTYMVFLTAGFSRKMPELHEHLDDEA